MFRMIKARDVKKSIPVPFQHHDNLIVINIVCNVHLMGTLQNIIGASGVDKRVTTKRSFVWVFAILLIIME